MTSAELDRLVKDAEARLAAGQPLSRREQVILLAGLLLRRSTRKETRYGQA